MKIIFDTRDTGRFDKMVSVFGNMKNSPLVIQLRGIVE
jgi:hypothetical protein